MTLYMHAAEPLSHFVDDYLGYLYEACPTHATLDGIHLHDDLLEDFRRGSIDTHLGALAGFARRLDAIPVDRLPLHEQVDHAIATGSIRARLFELEEVRTWERSPHMYGEVLASSLATQAIFTYAPEEERARRVLSKLRQVPRLIQAARDNVKDPPAIFVKVGLDTWRGVKSFIDSDLPRAFSSVDDLHLLADLADASTEAVQAAGAYVEYLENDLRPRAKGTFRLGPDRFEQKLRFEEGLHVPVERLLAIAMRELQATQEEFRSVAGRMNGGDPLEAWRKTKHMHPAPGTLIRHRARAGQRAAARFSRARRWSGCPRATTSRSAATPEFFRWSFASMWTPGPFETRASRAMYYLTDADPSWPARATGRAPARLQHARRSGPSRCTRCSPATTSTTSTCARSNRRSAARRCSRRPPTSKAGRTTASR